jgi:hypothetical protein
MAEPYVPTARLVVPIGKERFKYNPNIGIRAFKIPGERIDAGEAWVRGVLAGPNPTIPGAPDITSIWNILDLRRKLAQEAKGKK